MLVEGARRVGGVRQARVPQLHTRRFRRGVSRRRELFDDVSDLDYLFLQFQLRYSARLFDRESLIIFDEVQMCPRARQAIK